MINFFFFWFDNSLIPFDALDLSNAEPYVESLLALYKFMSLSLNHLSQ